MSKKPDPVNVLKTVIDALQPLSTQEKQWVLQSAISRWPLNISAPNPAGGTETVAVNPSGGQPPENPQAPIGQQDAKAFMKSKNPQSETQRIACLAYYLSHTRNTQAFKATDITKLNTEAKGPNFNIARAVANASNSKHGYLSPIGKGQKQISLHGEELVDALPDVEKVKQVEANRKKGKRGRPKKRGVRKSNTA